MKISSEHASTIKRMAGNIASGMPHKDSMTPQAIAKACVEWAIAINEEVESRIERPAPPKPPNPPKEKSK